LVTKDLTVVYITANETPDGWATFQMGHFLEAVGKLPIISISRKPINLGTNLIDNEQKCYWNIYRQLLRGAKHADTEFIAMAEDDVLYSKEHFTCFRPLKDEVGYNRSRWTLLAWEALYSLKQRVSNCSLIAPRELLIEALQERMDKHLDGMTDFAGEIGRKEIERGLGVTHRKMVDFFSEVPIVQLSHINGTEHRQRIKRKKHGQIKAYDIPYWGKASDIIKHYE